ncbi:MULTISPECIES: enoyl-CoA hydratase/isomerase family protein [Pseudonocardia]|uniref:Enoyl-CoA hydratase n=2 Tax=Pseudonocardia TaxID=1847 RepID=A0ABQ0S3S7_9PSEU|nr:MULTISPECIES: enoyl-CoA hydratase/isomerase family protein [Pseudonocardia]OSY35606.1 putative enoyl-CoA hydratase echA6 [Pseudonocardia autotrophica]TDN76897.1 enoyl-CoA hydratase/carnithine racemase [Pseudonocardia autotrophica]BBG00900.1 enoyl-CoA hydratase [Pseudonocardia autotrophica]GEC27541.1 enoyl-CoA hydratase [Pseudonocardia saturnea]
MSTPVRENQPADAGGEPRVRVEYDAEVVTVSIDRPRRANALDASTVEELHAALDVADERRARGVVVNGSGRHFCAGFDMSQALEQSDGDLLRRFVRIEQLLRRLRRSRYLTIACVGGKAVGAGADIVASCTHRLVDPGTTLRFPGLGFGVVLGTRHLAAVVGTGTARTWLSESREIDAVTAHRHGLATEVLAREEQNREALRLVRSTTGIDTTALAAALDRTDPASAIEDASDMDALVASLTRPGLRDRLAAYLGTSSG